MENLVRSIDKHFNAPLVIIDDGSTDQLSVQVLERLSKKYEVVIKPVSAGEDRVTGGLHANMQWALSLAAERGVKLALMVQEDMQLVRNVVSNDLEVVLRGFDQPHSSFVIQTCFLKANRAKRVDDGTMLEVAPGLYERSKTESGIRGGKCFAYSDTGFFSVPLFQKYMGDLRTGERANEIAADEKGLRLRFMADPFMHFLPLPSDRSRRVRRWQDQVADRLAGAAIHPIRSLSDEEASLFTNRDKRILPYAEDFLDVPTMPQSEYWSLRAGRSNLHARGGWRRIIARLL
ncbi:hypothetical protein ABUK73_10855 [Agrobacterium sp. BA1120]|uniref:hypothetical protein n=1 Tax=Agrobacterium sp. BA1120 TaxID=3228927 RepID=UPI00336A8C2A